MNSSVTLSAPTVYTLSASGPCTGSTLTLSGSQAGVQYYLYQMVCLGFGPEGEETTYPRTGTGSSIFLD